MSMLIGRLKKTASFFGPKVLSYLILGFFAGFLLSGVEIGFAFALQLLLYSIGVIPSDILSVPTWMPAGQLKFSLIFLFSLGVARSLLYWFQIFAQGSVMEEFRYQQRRRLLQWVFNADTLSTSEVINMFTEKTSNAGNVIIGLQSFAIQATVGLVLGVKLFLISPLLTVVVTTLLLLMLLPLRKLDRKTKESGILIDREWEKTNSRMLMSIRNLLLMQIYGTQEAEEKKTQSTLATYRFHMVSFHSILGVKFVLPQILGMFLICVIAYLAKSKHLLEVGVILSYFYIFMRFLNSVSTSIQAVASIQLYMPQLQSLAGWWAKRSLDGPRTVNLREALPKNHLPSRGPIGWKLSNIDFKYDSTGKIFSNINLIIPPGTTLVITGASGSGKSTLINLLLGVINPTAGKLEVLLDEGASYPLSQVRPRLLQSLGYVGPESFLTEGTLFQNLTYGLQRQVTAEEVSESLRLAECQYVSSLPGGLDYVITEHGQGLSAGQKQRLSLARALLRNPSALLLDEATSNLDSETESKLIDTLQNLKTKVTVIAVTHRDALLKIADQRLDLGQNS